MTITIRHDHLELAPAAPAPAPAPSAAPDAAPALDALTISFQRTLRIPDDGRTYPLPPGLGEFPLRRIGDRIVLPMYQREAMWLSFGGATPHALQVGIGGVCALTGERWTDHLRSDPQNYVVTHTQPWLDGIASGRGTIRQFVAVPLGSGLTVEAQLTGREVHGGIQLQAFAPKPGRVARAEACRCFDDCEEATGSMGLGAGGTMAQKIYPDPYGLDAWSTRSVRVTIDIVNSARWQQLTGEAPPPSPVSAQSYIDAGLPWFSLYDEHAPTLAPTAKLAGVKSIDALNVKKLPWR